MNIEHSGVRDMVVGISLAESERFDVPMVAYSSSRENGIPLRVNALRAAIDLVTGETIVKAYGHLRRKDGMVGDRSRDLFLEADQVPEGAKEIINVEVRALRDKIAAGAPVHF